MPRLIDDEAEPADRILVARHQKAALLRTLAALTADRGDNLGHTRLIVRTQRSGDNPVAGMLPRERLPILLVRFAWCERPIENRFPRIRAAVANRFIRAPALISREQFLCNNWMNNAVHQPRHCL
ncbi:hypothetical protein SFGR64A_31945 (plasmid) [Sinorhizobium fredii GR64]|nr:MULTISPECIES: hypothetical protein [Sinorhizobium]WOS67009.1 hypothetical protein SFGR64A_31945 [Sinorhizobium fredii GR64]